MRGVCFLFLFLFLLSLTCSGQDDVVLRTYRFIEMHGIYPKRALELALWIERWSRRFDIPISVVVGIIGAESGFRNIVGDNGKAYGYGQLHLDTVWFIHKKFPFLRKVRRGKDLIYNPELNIAYTCAYIRYLFDTYGRNIYAICRYNGIPSKRYKMLICEWITKAYLFIGE